MALVRLSLTVQFIMGFGVLEDYLLDQVPGTSNVGGSENAGSSSDAGQ